MPGGWVTWVVLLVVVDFAFIMLIMRATIGQIFQTFARTYPSVEPEPDTVWKRYQSFRFGLVNAGLCVHVGVDDQRLHLHPIRLLKWAGACDVSVPWDAVELGKKQGRYRKAKIGATTLWGPAWALDLAETGNDAI